MERLRRFKSAKLRRLLDADSDDSTRFESKINDHQEEQSPYAEVRAAVPNDDDHTITQNTLRVWTLGFVSITVCGALNTILAMQATAFSVGPHIVTVGVWPLGKLWEIFVPKRRVFGIELNSGPFNIKEHALITIMATCALGDGPAYATELLTVKKYFLGISPSWGFIMLLIISSQLIGLAMAGLVKRILVYPSPFIFPNSLVEVTLLGNLHIKSNYVANGWRISRLKLLLILMCAGAAYQWFPSFLAQFLKSFGWAGWIVPNNVLVNQLFGINQGIALMPLCFDWNSISGFLGSPLVPPLGTLINMLLCTMVFFWFISPILNFANVWYGNYLPLVSPGGAIYDRYQNVYNINRVLDDQHQFNAAEYAKYSPLFLTVSTVMAYGLNFAAFASTVVNAVIFDIPTIRRYWRQHHRRDDLHMRLMRHYDEVPMLVYVAIYIICFVMMVIVSTVYAHLGVPMLLLAVGISSIMFIPSGFLYATTNITLALNVISEMIAGYVKPGNAEANMLFKVFCFYPHLLGVMFLENLKVGHYLKLAPKVVICVQIFGAVWGGIQQWLVMMWLSAHFSHLCAPDQHQGFTCPFPQVFHNSALLWGTIGSARIFEMYRPVLYFFLIGAVLPILSWFWLRKYRQSMLRHIHWPLFFNSMALIPPATPYNYMTYLQAGFLFTYYVRRRYFNWWAKYNYTVSAGLELAVILGQLIVLLTQLSGKVNRPAWWGNVGAFNSVDFNNVPRILLPPGGTFGPEKW